MSYIVFARKYRPQAFDEVVGQSHITTTLKNAIGQNRVAHAYIFAGPRGVGKTTTARILAKALNCEKGPTDNPCNKCSSCQEITHGVSLDILEIDGASNRGIDEIRNLRENVKFAPSKGRFKVYIIDEVHMLTQEAFNALLKTLEEPPAHVKFIFATTQAHKVPPTILSRCQRFDFRRISIKDIVASLKTIAKSEGLKVDDEVLILIAKHSDGSMRDAQVVLDQISSNTLGKISVEDASKILGAVSDDILFNLADSIKAHDPVSALKMISSLADEGKDIVQVILYLIEHLRNLSVMKVANDPSSLIDASLEKIKRYEEQSRKFSVEEILYIVYTLSSTLDFVRKASMARVPFEVAMVKLTREGSILQLSELLERLDKIEKSLSRKIDGSVSLRATDPSTLRQAHGASNDAERSRGTMSRDEGSEAISKTGSQQAAQFKKEIASPAKKQRDRNDEEKLPIAEDKPIKSAQFDEIISSWPAILNQIKDRKISAAMYLKEGYPESLESDMLSISFPKSSQFHKEMLESPDCKGLILKAIKDSTGMSLKVKFTISGSGSVENNTAKDAFEGSLDDNSVIKDRPSKSDEEPIITDALEIFDGEIELDKGKAGL